MDPYEGFDNKDSYGHLLQKFSWLNQPLGELMGQHLQTFDMSNIVKEFMDKARQ
jgi:hypothetical protein